MAPNIIDTHVHIWDLNRVEYSWLKDDTSILNQTYLLDDLTPQAHAAGIKAGVLVQAANNLQDTELMLETARDNEWIKGVVGWLPLIDPEKVATLLQDNFAKEPYIKGFRHLIHNEPNPDWLLQATVIESLSLLASHGYTFDLVGIHTDHIQTAIKVAERVPQLRMVFDHLNQPPIASKQKYGEWGEWMKLAAGHTNFYAKISGLGTASGNFDGWHSDDLKPYIDFVLEQFGTDRCFCGGDWPVSLLAGDYNQIWDAYKKILSDLLSESEQNKILSTNAAHFYQIQ
jgi:L-fuconolactonase